MCILAFCCHASPRWPVIFVHNRDEFVHRATAALRLEPNGILWARDCSIAEGGSWLGFNVASGAFAALTNCRRAPTTVAEYPFEVVREHSVVDAEGRVQFTPDASRGTLVRDFLLTNSLPPVRPWDPPVHSGYNLITANLYGGAADGFRYTTNRYRLQHDVTIDVGASGEVHAMANSFLDNPNEPKTMFLRDAVRSLVEEHGSDADGPGLLDGLGRLLCAQNGFDVRDPDVLESTKPYLGLTAEQRQRLSGVDSAPDETFVGDWNLESEALLHRDVFVTAGGPSYGTRTQTVVLVENQRTAEGVVQQVVHFGMRNTTSPTIVDDWDVHRFPVPRQHCSR